jgi:hypothetical protein
MALSISSGLKHYAVPLLSRLMRGGGNSSKLDAVKTLLRVIAPVFAGREVIMLIDSWYMKWPLIEYAFALGFNVIGQVRRDTALYAIPALITGQKGRPRKFGDKYTPDIIAALPEVRAVWMQGPERGQICLWLLCVVKVKKPRANISPKDNLWQPLFWNRIRYLRWFLSHSAGSAIKSS